MYYIKAPQNGYVNKALLSGLGENIKEGTAVVSIMPADYDVAVETYIDPIDLPLIQKTKKLEFGSTDGLQLYFQDGLICLMELLVEK